MGGDEGILNVLNVRSRTMILNTILSSSAINSIAFSCYDERIGIGLHDGTLCLLNPKSDWQLIGEVDHSESAVLCLSWAIKILACGRADGSVTIFDTENAFSSFFVPVSELYISNLPVRTVAFGENGRFLTISGDNGIVSILSADDGWVLHNRINFGCGVLSTKWSPADRYVAIAGSGEMFRIVNTITWTMVDEANKKISSILKTGVDSISSLDWSSDSKLLAFGGTGSGIIVMEASDWSLQFTDTKSSTL